MISEDVYYEQKSRQKQRMAQILHDTHSGMNHRAHTSRKERSLDNDTHSSNDLIDPKQQEIMRNQQVVSQVANYQTIEKRNKNQNPLKNYMSNAPKTNKVQFDLQTGMPRPAKNMLIISGDQTISSHQAPSNNSCTGGSSDQKLKDENLKNARAKEAGKMNKTQPLNSDLQEKTYLIPNIPNRTSD